MFGPMAVADVPTPTRPPAASVAAGREALVGLLGADRVSTGADVLAQHGRDESFHPEAAPDVVVWPRSIDEAAGIVRIAAEHHLPLVPFGAGTSLEGHVAALAGGISIDMREMDRIGKPSIEDLDVTVQEGATRRALDARLRPEGVFFAVDPGADATIGGMVATGASGTMTVRYGAMRENVLALTIVNGRGEVVRTHSRARKSSAGYDLTRLLIGSEGTLGLITEAWVRVRPRPGYRASAPVRFAEFAAGAEAARALSQSGLYPANCRLIDAREAEMTGAGDGSDVLLVLGFESAERDVERWMTIALEICGDHGGTWERRGPDDRKAVGSWREAFLRAPYLRDVFIAIGVLSETFETAITWERFPAFHERVMADVSAAVREVCGEAGSVTCRFTHVYPDGPAPYYTILAPARRGAELEQWAELKSAASDAVIAGGGTITHHHAVGRAHRPWYDRQRPEPFAAALRGAKAAVDPTGALNPGVLIDP